MPNSPLNDIQVDSFPPASRKLAQEEEHAFKDGERGEAYRTHIHNVVITGIWVIGIMLIAMILVRGIHFMLPTCWHWLTAEQTHNLERVIFSGIIVSLAGKYFKHYGFFRNG